MQQFLRKERKYLVADIVLYRRQKTNKLSANVLEVTELDREQWKQAMKCAGTVSEKE
jgi:hypothetical protein